MKLVSFCSRTVILVLLAGAPLLAQGQLWLVDQAAGPGFDFTELQPAIDAAAGGDTILVRAGTYGDGVIDGKELVVAADAGATFLARASTLAVRNLASSQSVVIRGLSAGRWTLEACDGPIWLESVDGDGWGVVYIPGLCFWFGSGTADKVAITDCADVVVVRGGFAGGKSSTAGQDGIHAVRSNLTLFETRVGGGLPQSGGQWPGGDALDLTDCTLFASGCLFLGGCGAEGDQCFPGGHGGAGIRWIGGTAPELLECTLAGGAGGCAAEPLCPYCALPGQDTTAPCSLIAGYARDYELASPGIGGQTTALAYAGKAGDLVFSLVGLGQDALFLPALAGTLVLPIPPIVIAHGPASGAGTLGVAVPLPPLPPGFEAFTVYAQGAAISGVGAAVLCAPSQLTIR